MYAPAVVRPNTPGIGTGPSTRVGGAKELSRAERLSLDVQGRTLQQLGIGNPDGLPNEVQAALRQLVEGKTEAALEKTDPVAAARQLQRVVARHAGATAKPPPIEDPRFALPGNAQISKDNGDGSFKLVGAPAAKGSPLLAMFAELGIDPNAMGPRVQAELDKARGAALGNPKNWSRLGSKLAEARVLDTPPAQVGKLLGVSGPSTAQVGTTPIAMGGDLGLAKTAKTVEQASTGPQESVAEAVNKESVRDPGAAERRAATVAAMQKTLIGAGMTSAQAEAFAPTLERVLQRGQGTAKTPSDKSWAVARAAHEALGYGPMPKDRGGLPTDGTMDRPAATVAASLIVDLAEKETGAKLDLGRVPELARAIEGHAKAGAAKTKSRSSLSEKLGGLKLGARKPAGAGGPKTRGPKLPEHKQLAQEYAAALGLHADDPATAHTVRDIESAFAQVLQGSKGDGDAAMRALKWVERKTGDEGGAASRHLESVLDRSGKDSEVPGLARSWALQKVAMCAAMGPEAYKAHVQQQMGGAMNPMMGAGGMVSPYGQMEQQLSSNFRSMQCSMILMDPALSHEDKITLFLMMMATFQDQDRMRKMAEIADVDQKAALKKQAQEAQGAAGGKKTGKSTGPSDAAKTEAAGDEPEAEAPTTAKKKKPAAGTTTQATPTAGAEASVKADPKAAAQTGAQTATAAAPPPPKGPNTTSTAGGGGPPPPKGPDDPSKTPGGPGGPGGPDAPSTSDPAAAGPMTGPNVGPMGTGQQDPEGPKSKEILMAELDRIGKFRDMLFQMVNDMLRKRAQTQREIMRG